MNAMEISSALPAILTGFPEISLVYLFGSHVEGNVGPSSDYDLAVLLDHDADSLEIQPRFTHALVSLLKTDRIDVVILNQAPITLAYHVIAKGITLFARDEYTRVEFEAQTLSRYCDYLPILRNQREQILNEDIYHDRRVQRYRTAFERTERTLKQITAAAKQTAH